MMNRLVSIILLALGIVSLTLGLIFLCASINNTARIPIAVILLVLGAGMAAGGGVMLRRQRELSPETVADRIVGLAEKDDDAELAVTEIVAGLRLPEKAVLDGLDLLEKRGRCRREYRDDHAVYVFPGLKQSKLIRKCSYCGSTFSVKDPLHKCPNCGGTVELVREGS
ncbi:MAG: hypothetical protein ACK2T3_12960 [Candidatus Promineifilaceae bacterium]|jgi:hypothetical protein